MLLKNLTQLRELDLTEVNISSTIPPNFSSHITTLKLANTGLHGILPESIFHLPNLQVLNLIGNDQLSGHFPKTKWNSSASVRELYISQVNFSGNFLPESLGYLTSLRSLQLQSCNISGPIPKSLWNVTRLESLYLGDNHLEGPIPLFTSGLQNLSYLGLSNNFLSGAIPSWIFSLPSLSELGLNDNHFSGPLKDFKYNTLVRIDLGHNQLQGPLPNSLQNLVKLIELDLSTNHFSGNVDVSFFSNLKQLSSLDLSYNSISLTNENIVKSTLPQSLSHLALSACEVKELDFLRSAKKLLDLDLSNNKIQGRIPDWAWSNWMHSMTYLNLSHNMLTKLPTSLFQNLKAMRRLDQTMKAPGDEGHMYYQDSVVVVTKGLELEVVRILSLYTTMDLSSNKFEGHIPSMMVDLIALRVLNLSHNGLQGHIPPLLGKLSVVESLDLSFNQLSGEIPKTLASLTFLAVLNLSHNHLEGCIPKGNQFDTFGNNSYVGNDGLRGFPVSGGCGSNWTPSTNNTTFVPDEESDSTFLSELSWKVVLMGYEEEEIMVSRQVPGPTIFNSKTLRHAMTGEM
ncbi:hypothetical protein HAX54_014305 [Datura stramonium]|uniref:Disease resistance R13L4/SHOC-2-like LRR domain-containing protein n=1 Tax=Datura stramonium TaxID=4076 RepID=A0ABS8Y5U5_DATST|nr:hypothetical protein [Datura stramonium]